MIHANLSVVKVKHVADWSVQEYKARLVAKTYAESYEINYFEILVSSKTWDN